MNVFQKGADAYIIENGIRIRPVTVMSECGGLFTLKFRDGPGGTRLRKSRMYRNEKDAECFIKTEEKPAVRPLRSPHSYGYY